MLTLRQVTLRYVRVETGISPPAVLVKINEFEQTYTN